jgi:hypothetical protein
MALAGFGDATSPLLTDTSAYGILARFKENLAKLSEFVKGAMNFGALSCAMNLCKTLGKLGCTHFVGLKRRREFEGPSELGETLGGVTKSIRNFMKYFWFKFGRANTRSLAEARCAMVRILSIFVSVTIFLSFCCFLFLS